VKFGEWLPDLPAYGHDGLTVARNVFPTALGYEPVKAYSAVTGALPSAWMGGRTFIGVDGTVVPLAGTNAGLYAYISGAWTNKYSASYSNKWQFAQFGDLAIGVQGAAPVKYTIASATGALLGGSPPNGAFITTAKDFVVISGVDSANSTVYWSAINNPEGWTPGTGQSDTQVLPDGGKVTGLAGGEYMLVFQRDQIWRGQYVGPPFIFQFDKVSQGIGCIAPNSIVQAGRTVYFLSSRGYCSFTDFRQYSAAEIEDNVSAAIDPVRKLAVWAMPRRLWVHNFELGRWSDIEGSFTGVTTDATRSYTLEQISALYPGGIETIPGSLDDPIWSGGTSFLSIVAEDGTLGSFGSQTNLQAALTMALMEPAKGRDIRIRAARLDSDATGDVTLNIEGRHRLGDSPTAYSGSSIRMNGDMPIRASGRYVQPSITFAEGADWTYAQGLDFVMASPGARQ
jgi:hypothetical protein